jgi:hypothetical protein
MRVHSVGFRQANYLIGSAGVPNYGDELIMRLWLNYLRLSDPKRPVWIDVQDPGVAAVLLAGDHPQLHTTDTLWRTAAKIGALPPEEWTGIVERFIRHRGTPRADAGLELLAEAGSVQLVGGGYLNSMWSVNLVLPLLAAESGRAFGHALFGSGLGLLPLSDEDRTLLSGAFCDFDSAECRDAAELAPRIPGGVLYGTDDALLGFHPKLSGLWRNARREPAPKYMLALQGDMHAGLASRDEALETALAELRRAGWAGEPLGVVEAIPPDDAWVLPVLAERGVEVVFYPFIDLWRNGLPIQPGQYWVSTRFHFHLLVAGSGVNGTALAISEDYYLPKHKSLSILGTGWRLVDRLGGVVEAGNPAVTKAFSLRAPSLAAAKWAQADRIYAKSRRRSLRSASNG